MTAAANCKLCDIFLDFQYKKGFAIFLTFIFYVNLGLSHEKWVDWNHICMDITLLLMIKI